MHFNEQLSWLKKKQNFNFKQTFGMRLRLALFENTRFLRPLTGKESYS